MYYVSWSEYKGNETIDYLNAFDNEEDNTTKGGGIHCHSDGTLPAVKHIQLATLQVAVDHALLLIGQQEKGEIIFFIFVYPSDFHGYVNSSQAALRASSASASGRVTSSS